MAANLYKLRLYRGPARKGNEVEEYLDLRNDTRLRELLIARVTEVMGTSRVNLDQGWELRIIHPRNGSWQAKVRVDSAGRTVVQR